MLFQSAGSWGASHYAMTNYEEYFAEGVSNMSSMSSTSTVRGIFKGSEGVGTG